MLAPPEGNALEDLNKRETLVDWNHLTGKRGRTTTQLTPSGKALFGDELVDVICDGEVIPAGTDVFVVEVSGNRVLVQAVGDL
jgi:membrane-bound ClpP family serine protease